MYAMTKEDGKIIGKLMDDGTEATKKAILHFATEARFIGAVYGASAMGIATVGTLLVCNAVKHIPSKIENACGDALIEFVDNCKEK